MEKKKPKAIILGSAHPLRGGGIATFNERLARAFITAGYETSIFSFALQYPAFLFPGSNQLTDEPPPPDLEIITRINSINPINWITSGLAIRKENPDLLIVRYWIPFMGPCLGTICRLAGWRRKTKIIAIADNIIPHEKRPGDRFFTRYFIRGADAFLTMSKSVLEDLNQFDTRKPRLYNPHPLYDNYGASIEKTRAKENLHLDPKTSYILFFGFIREYKGLDILLTALSDERLRRFGIKLIVAGEFYGDREFYIQKIEDLHLSEWVILHDRFIPNSEVGNYFCAADLVVQPYRSATQSGVTQVAYHFDKPIITTCVGGLSELVPDGKVGFVVNPDSGEIAQSIYRFYSEALEEEFTEQVSQEKKKFSWENLIATIQRLASMIG